MLLPEEVPLAKPEAPLVEFPLPEPPVPVPVLPPVAAVRAVDAVRAVALAPVALVERVVAPVVTIAVPLTVDTADAVAVTELVPALNAAIEEDFLVVVAMGMAVPEEGLAHLHRIACQRW